MNVIKLSAAFKDDRGEIIDLIDNDEINAITLISFNEGAVRANHYHEKTTQWNYIISGKIRLVTQMPGEDAAEVILEKGGFAVTVPHERHALQALQQSEVMILTKGPRSGKDYESDTYRLEEPLI